MKTFILTILIGASFTNVFAQAGKVQAAWRNLTDYESSFDTLSLIKAQEAILPALENEKSKDLAKTWLYKSKIDYYFFRENYNTQEKKNKTAVVGEEAKEFYYQQSNSIHINNASEALLKSKTLDNDKTFENEIKVAGTLIVNELNNIAYSKFKHKKFDEAAQLFSNQYHVTKLFGMRDTNVMYNAVLSASKTGKPEITKKYAEDMIHENIGTAYTYLSLCDAKLALKDTLAAIQTIQSGRTLFPNDNSLMNKETEIFLNKGDAVKALENLSIAISKSPENVTLYLVRGNLFDNLANPIKGEKPKDFETLMSKAELDYKKATELDPSNFDAWYNCGAVYNNVGSYYQLKADAIPKLNAEQKALSEKAQEFFKKAVASLEKALSIDSNETTTITALRKLYLLIGDKTKSEQMAEKLKK